MSGHSQIAMTVEVPEVVPDHLFDALWRYRLLIIGSVLLSFIVGSVLVSRQTPLYVSSARLLFTRGSNAASSDVIPDAYLRSQAELVTSAQVLNDAAVTLVKLHKDILAHTSDPYGLLKQNLDVKVSNSEPIVTVAFASPEPADSAAIVNAVVDSFANYQSAHFKNSSHEAASTLMTERQQVTAELQNRQKELQMMQSQNPSLEDATSADLQKHKLAQIGDQLSEGQASVVTLNAKLDSLMAQYGPSNGTQAAGANSNPASNPPPAAGGTTRVMGIASPPVLDQADLDPAWVQNELDLASANLELLQTRGLSASDPSVQEALASIAKLSKKLAACHRNTGLVAMAQARNDLDLAHRRVVDLQNKFDVQNKLITDGDNKRAEMTSLRESASQLETNVQQIDSQLKAVSIGNVKPVEMHVLDTALPATAARDSRFATLAISLSIGLIAGIGLALGLHQFDHHLRSPTEIRELLRLPVLAILPQLSSASTVMETGLVGHSDPMSLFADAARTVRSAIFFAGKSTAAKTILVASASSREGRTSFASTLAIAMAQAGSKTLLVDADFRKPAIQSIFEILRPTGLSDVLSGKSVLDRVIHRTPIERLEVLPCGTIPKNPEDLVNSGGFDRLIEQLSARYQCVVLDSPPVSAHADSRILAAAADLTVFLVRAGESSRKKTNQSLEQLLNVGARVLGTVINGARLKRPVQKSRGILRFVEEVQDKQPDESSEMQPATDGHPPATGSGLAEQRVKSNLVPDVEVVD